MNGWIGGFERVTERISYGLAQLAAVSALLLTAVVTYSVIMRFVFNSSQNWTDELATYCLLWMVFFGLTYTLNAGAHIRIDFFTVMLSTRMQQRAEIVIWTIGLLFAILLLLGCYSAIENFIRRDTYSTDGMDIPLYLPALPMLLGSVMFTIAMATRLLRLILIGPVEPTAPDLSVH
jgi:TRAP-type C4-dicarboxylate transport system permease small subunit